MMRSARTSLGGRVASLDALRGFDMFWIIGGDAVVRSLPAIKDTPVTRFLASQVEHRAWAGFTFYDLIFPLFHPALAQPRYRFSRYFHWAFWPFGYCFFSSSLSFCSAPVLILSKRPLSAAVSLGMASKAFL